VKIFNILRRTDYSFRNDSILPQTFRGCVFFSVFLVFLCSCSSSGEIYYRSFVKSSYFSSSNIRNTRLSDSSLRRKGFRRIGVLHTELVYSRCTEGKCEKFKHDKNSIDLLYSEAKKRGAQLVKVLENNKRIFKKYTDLGKCIKGGWEKTSGMRYVNGKPKWTSYNKPVCVKWTRVKKSRLSYKSRAVLWRRKSDL